MTRERRAPARRPVVRRFEGNRLSATRLTRAYACLVPLPVVSERPVAGDEGAEERPTTGARRAAWTAS